ncbi:GDYXXLXY domain-containing protein [Hymenobacter sp. BT635]|uniref:GDYXXLXY domain-containing protein n=1 Tax=Hymenobacter nitidus TaxID=2880929 RepID=A0ABS8ADA1_9BACT|nr:GDYXXLXY domain-containing protein [Hymenobacter nitidus]MCB2378390.1 GDYXXLXY domain-containing protein [Hymenobacter nitidus]
MDTFPTFFTRRRLLGLAIAAQMLFILAVAGAGYATTALGRTIVLRTTPVDPRDLLYGDYVRLNYSISQVKPELWHGSEAPKKAQPVYVLLQPANGVYEAAGVYATEPAAAPEQAILRGWVTDSWRRGIRLRYNLERYYVPENTGLRLEKSATRRPLLVRVSVAPWGQARITQVGEVGR